MAAVERTVTILRTSRDQSSGDQRTFPQPGQLITIHYVAYLARTGESFDSSVKRGMPFEFVLGANTVIRGMDQAVRQMSVGEQAFVSIPSELGYGARGDGPIPPDADLMFDMKLLSVRDAPADKEEVSTFHNSSKGGSLDALKYLNKLQDDGKLDVDLLNKLLCDADIGSYVTSRTNTLTMLHIVSNLADSQAPASIRSAIFSLVKAGACLDTPDKYGQVPLAYVVCCLEEDDNDSKEEGEEVEAPDEDLVKAVESYLELEQQTINDELTARVLCQIDKIPEDNVTLWLVRSRILDLLEQKHISAVRLEELRQGNKLISYLATFYDTLQGADPNIVKKFLDARADPGVVQTHSGSNAFHFVALNAYGAYDDVLLVCKMLLQRRSEAAAVVDQQKFTPFSLAADYKDTAAQFKCPPNPSVLLALGDLLPQYDVDAGFVCLRVDAADRECMRDSLFDKIDVVAGGGYSSGKGKGKSGSSPVRLPEQKQLRFAEGDRVKCLVQSPGLQGWEEGTVVALWYREKSWPVSHPGAPYEVRLDIGSNVFALADTAKIIKAENEKIRQTKTKKRFMKQLQDDKWQLVDTITGKSKPCSPPSSDSD